MLQKWFPLLWSYPNSLGHEYYKIESAECKKDFIYLAQWFLRKRILNIFFKINTCKNDFPYFGLILPLGAIILITLFCTLFNSYNFSGSVILSSKDDLCPVVLEEMVKVYRQMDYMQSEKLT
jgi:hypothetical protein